MINKIESPNKLKLLNEYYSLKSECELSYINFLDIIDNINSEYGISSVSEDIVLNTYLSIFNTLKSSKNSKYKSIITDSFLSNNLNDLSFPVNKRLNVDTQNGDLTLPIISTNDIVADSIIIDNNSNGSPSRDYSKIEDILVNSNSSLYVYEKIVNTISMNPLDLSFTIRLKEENISNGIYLKLYSQDGSSYANIKKIQISKDGIQWIDIKNNTEINKADYYIRYSPEYIRYIKIYLTQNVYSIIETGFGARYKYSIGIRQIQIKRTEYDKFGEYVSVPFMADASSSFITLEKEDEGNVKYFISTDNGGQWKTLEPNVPSALSDNKSIDDINTQSSIRLKIQMSKDNTVVLKNNKEEFYSYVNGNSKYNLENTPIEIKAFIGKNISVGNLRPYNLQITNTDKIDSSLINESNCITENSYQSYILRYIPYYNGIENDLVIKIDNALIKNDRSIYSIIRHPDQNCSILNITSQLISKISGNVSIYYKPYLYNSSVYKSNIIKLPKPSFIKTKDGFIINVIKNDTQNINIDTNTINSTNQTFLGHEADKVFDNNISTYWKALAITNEQDKYWHVSFKLKNRNALKSIILTPAESEQSYMPLQYKIFGSQDNINWIEVHEIIKPSMSWVTSETFQLPESCPFLYYKIEMRLNSRPIYLQDINGNTVLDTNSQPVSNTEQLNTCKIAEIGFITDSDKVTIEKANFSVLDENHIEIEQSLYNPKYDYEILYYPSIEITDFISKIDKSNIEINSSLENVSAEIKFEYTYENELNSEIIKFYTPIVSSQTLGIS